MQKLILFIILLLGMNSCNEKEYQPLNCDLIFQIAKTSDFSMAITDATASHDNLKYDHVGMVILDEDGPKVIEASAKNGVSVVTLEQFIKDSPTGYVIKRVSADFSTDAVITNAKSHLGEPYDWSYLPDNGKMYCSELIYESFIDAKGQRIFHAKPMNFRNEKGEMPQFWIDLFKKLKQEIPEGVIGTNPNDLSKETALEEVWHSFCK